MTTSIEWCDETWNPVVGCSRVSAGCDHCYAIGVAHRAMQPTHVGLTKMRPREAARPGPDWTGEVRCVPERLAAPLSWRKPRRVFVNSMSDLFHRAVPDDFIAEVFGVMAVAGHHGFGATWDAAKSRWRDDGKGPHTFLVLTKRADRLRLLSSPGFVRKVAASAYRWAHDRVCAGGLADDIEGGQRWPLPNVHVGVSAEDQATWDERVPLLLQCPAAVRWVSYEPALGPIDGVDHLVHRFQERGTVRQPGLDWVVVGGESGPAARRFDTAWARWMVQQCQRARVPVFVKQLGARPVSQDFPGGPLPLRLVDRKGGDMAEWPEDLRVRELPEVLR